MSLLNSHPPVDHEAVVAAIRIAEVKTSGIITVMVARRAVKDPIVAAQAYFAKAGLSRTPHRNGVLIFMAPRSRNFAVIGDTAVHEKCGDSFWANLASAMGGYFKKGELTDGLIHGIETSGSILAVHFPRTRRDPPAPAPSVTGV